MESKYIRFSFGQSSRAPHRARIPIPWITTSPCRRTAKLWVKNNFGNVDVRGVHGWSDLETATASSMCATGDRQNSPTPLADRGGRSGGRCRRDQ